MHMSIVSSGRSTRSGSILIAALAAASLLAAGNAPASAQQAGREGKKGQKAGGAAPRRPAPVPDDNAGFVALFDGKTLNNWDGDPQHWRVQDGAITGETTPDKVLKRNTFIIWRGGTTKDFELKAEYRITTTGNSGVQYRSSMLPDGGQWALKGYQADIDGQNNYTGMLYEERGRGFLSQRGQFVRMAEGGVPKLIGSPGEGDALKAVIQPGDWNRIHIIARGNVITQLINGRVMSIFIDEDSKGRAMEGLLGLQLHQGPPMKIEYRNIMYRGL